MRLLLLTAFVLQALAIPVAAQTSTAAPKPPELEMKMPAPPEQTTPQVIGGVPANPASWPATLFFATNEGACTSTVIGRRTVLTAAHCVADGQKGKISLPGSTVSVTCSHHPQYESDYHYDVALCLADGKIILLDGSRYETINVDSKQPAFGGSVTLLGYGCRQPGGGGASGALFQGQAIVSGYEALYLVTSGGAAVCFGDSGGASYMGDVDSRKIVGITSRGDISTKSYLTPVASTGIFAFLDKWSKDNSVGVCGISEDQSVCRD